MGKFGVKNDEVSQALTRFVDGQFKETLQKGEKNGDENMQLLQP
jgi:hypothetical protein